MQIYVKYRWFLCVQNVVAPYCISQLLIGYVAVRGNSKIFNGLQLQKCIFVLILYVSGSAVSVPCVIFILRAKLKKQSYLAERMRSGTAFQALPRCGTSIDMTLTKANHKERLASVGRGTASQWHQAGIYNSVIGRAGNNGEL